MDKKSEKGHICHSSMTVTGYVCVARAKQNQCTQAQLDGI